MTAGSLGCLVPPALAILIYAIAIPGEAGVDPSEMFLAAFLPAISIAAVLAAYAIWTGRKIPGEREPFDFRTLGRAIVDGIWALMLPVIVLGGIYGGFFAPFKAGSVAVVYSLIVTVFIYRELNLTKAIGALADAGKLMGMLVLIIGLAFGLNKFLTDIEVEKAFVNLLDAWNLGPVGFMFLVNVVLIVLGALMDSISATLIFAPILAPIAMHHYGMDPLHFGVVFVVNMEIGYLAPPVATNLFVASALFKKPFGQVCRAILPTLGITCAALAVFMYVPTCSMGLVNAKRGVDIWQPFPWDGEPVAQTREFMKSADESLENLSGEASTTEAEDKQLQQMDDDDYYGPAAGGDDGDAGVDEGGGLDLEALGIEADGDAGPPSDGDLDDLGDLDDIPL
jgi:C4-dicarboxylate transporter DctM subunit